jgi:hypothetical protein
MEKKNVPEVLTRSSRSESAKKMWERRRIKEQTTKEKLMTEEKFDWHLFLGATTIVITLGSIVFGCFFSLKSDLGDISKEITKIETVLILKGVAPAELFTSDSQ